MNNNYSELSITDNDINIQQGGFFSTSCNNISKALLAAKEQRFDTVAFMVKHDMIKDYSMTDSDNNTLLHYMVQDSIKYPAYEKLINILLNKGAFNKVLNVQNKDGNHPLLLSTINGNHLLCDKLVNMGSSLKLKNKMGIHVDTYEQNESRADTNNNLNRKESKINIMDLFFTKCPDNEQFTDRMPDRLSDVHTENASVNTERLVDLLVDNYVKSKGKKNIANYELQYGGKRSVKIYKRPMHQHFEIVGGNTNEEDLEKSKLFDETLKKIMEILKVDEDKAKKYRALLHYRAKKANPDVEHIEVVRNMKKSATKKVLESIDYDKEEKEYKKYIEEKKKQKKMKRNKTKKNKPNKSTPSKEKFVEHEDSMDNVIEIGSSEHKALYEKSALSENKDAYSVTSSFA